MDGFDLSIDEVDQDVFNGSPAMSDDGDGDIPLPEYIGIDSAIQDEEQARLKQIESQPKRSKTKSQREREMELKVLKPDSIRRQILERTINDGNNKVNQSSSSKSLDSNVSATNNNSITNTSSHVMNIVEKAGMSGIDKQKINDIIHEASKGSLFYKKQAQRQEEIHRSIGKMLNKVKQATPEQVANAKITCDKIIGELEKQRVFNRVIVHFDLDMFFAAVEIRDNPLLADKPIAVGGDSMVSTSNYIARKFGVRAAMPGFIARKLCPELLLIKPNGFKYRQASSEVFSILELYDPELTGMSLDEAYLDLTDYVKSTLERDGLELEEYYDGTLPRVWWSRASEVVQEIRGAIFEKTKLTCSAGIACNTLLSKISTDINKPDGQYMVEGYHKEVIDFIKNTPVGKVSGIGKVSGQFLNALEIKTCGDIYEKRHFLPLVFYEINVKFYLKVALGDGSTCIKSDEQRKSKSVERTFTAVKDTLVLLDKLDGICDELCNRYLKPYRIRGRTITVKLKRNTFTTTTRSYSMLVPTNDKLVIYSAAKNILLSEVANEPPEISYRLLGVKLSNLADEGVTTNQLTIDAMLRNQEMSSSRQSKSQASVHRAEQSPSPSPSETQQSISESITHLENIQESSAQDAEMLMRRIEETTQQSKTLNINDSITPSKSKITKGHKRKTPATKRIEDFFTPKQPKTVNKDLDQLGSPARGSRCDNYSENHDQQPDVDREDGGDLCKDTLTGPNELSQRERCQNEPNDEDFQCPYCFKPYSDFNLLEIHVEKCLLKTSIDVYTPFFEKNKKQTKRL